MSDWRQQARDLLEDSLLSYHDIGVAVGRSRDTIARFCKEEGISRPYTPKGHTSFENRPKLSQQHVTIGLRLALCRDNRTLKQVSEQTGISRYVLRAMEHGVHDYTLTELQKLSTFTGLPIEILP